MGATGALAACSSGDDDASGDAGSTTTSPESELSMFQVFDPRTLAAGSEIRAPFFLGDADGPLPDDLAPREVRVDVTGPGGDEVATDLLLPRRGTGLDRPYYALRFTPPAAGFYDLLIDTGDGTLTSQMQVVDASTLTAVGPGQPMPALATPTVADALGVDPLCTRDPQCDLHQRSVADLVGEQPFVLLVSTPAYCQIGVCGPVLEVLLDLVPDHADIGFVHAEPWQHPTPQDLGDPTAYVRDLGLSFEPSAYAVAADGTIADRLDFIFDADELGDLVGRLGG